MKALYRKCDKNVFKQGSGRDNPSQIYDLIYNQIVSFVILSNLNILELLLIWKWCDKENELSNSVSLIKKYQFCYQLWREVIWILQLTFTCSSSTIETLEKVWNMFKVNIKNYCWLWTGKCLVGYVLVPNLPPKKRILSMLAKDSLKIASKLSP